MNTDIWVALIAAGTGWGGILLTTYLVRRQAANDLRANIDREIEIAKKLRPDSGEVRMLELHISKSISALIGRESRRESNSETFAVTSTILGTSVALYALDFWRRHGVPELLHTPVEVVYWTLWAFYGLIFFGSLIRLFSATKTGVKYGYWRTRLVFSKARLAWWKRKTKRAEQIFAVRRAYDAYIQQWAIENKDALIAEYGQEEYDANNAELTRIIKMGDGIEERFARHDHAIRDRESEIQKD